MSTIGKGSFSKIDKFISQLTTLTIYYNPMGGSSKGLREFLNKNIVKWCIDNPQISVEVKVKYTHPHAVGSYLCGNKRDTQLLNMDSKEVAKQLENLRCVSGHKIKNERLRWKVNNPSMQGQWNPFLNR